MNNFKAAELCWLLHELHLREEYFRWQTRDFESTEVVDERDLFQAKALVEHAIKLSEDLRFLPFFQKAQNTETYLMGWSQSTAPSAPGLEIEFRNLTESLLGSVEEHSYLYVEKNRSSYIDNPALFGKEVLRAFPSTEHDAKEAGNCLAAECNTAAVFHMMRAVEWGLRALCIHLGLKKAKVAKDKYVPIAYADWERMLNQLYPLVESRIDKLKRGPQKQKAQEFYYPVMQDIKAIRDAWRNHVMHARRRYSSLEASAILGHVRRLLSTLSTRVSEH